MKKLLIGLSALVSITAFSAEVKCYSASISAPEKTPIALKSNSTISKRYIGKVDLLSRLNINASAVIYIVNKDVIIRAQENNSNLSFSAYGEIKKDKGVLLNIMGKDGAATLSCHLED